MTAQSQLEGLGAPDIEPRPSVEADVVAFTVLGVAQPAGSKRGFVSGGHVRVVDANPKAAGWKADVSRIAYDAMQGRPLLTGPLALEATFYIVRPRGHYGVRGVRPAAPRYPTTRPDLLKLTRGLEDACTSVVWRDDSQVVDEVLRKRYAAEGEAARVEVSIRSLA